ncbi:hypothetical protein GGI25_004145 [Coemansia spiralis]|uniref:Uncharacterized protein n=2 Tax=Coemansia TaxID=4863 RepID=A0A9W8G743_9FUNG|nr:hypothetical protein EDC05_005728 [Coemansia umbellata]KAJ2620468.1 hypothetical protein GGI26_004956 [Coemansia sp. RSA 1358]KAJ2674997.1 hypothetical protein GGI25_004145 [Coemansia spiralis]
MSEYVRGVSMAFSIPEDEGFGVAEFPFELIESYVAVQDIPRYNFDLERKVKDDIVNFRDEMEMRTMHQVHQRRPVVVRRLNKLPEMARAKSTPLASAEFNQPSPSIVHFDTVVESPRPAGRPKATSDAHSIDPTTIRSRLPPLKKHEEPQPMGTRIKNIFRSKTRPSQKA